MPRNMIRASLAIALMAGVAVLALAGPAAAHEQRTVAGYDWEVGFGGEPPIAGYPNSVQLLLSRGGKPVTKIPGQLGVAVEFGSRTKDLQLEPNFEIGGDGIPGDYRAWFIPTRPGKYTFHFTGTLGGTRVDESFTSSPKGFDEAQDPTSEEFPVQDPTNGQLAERIDREIPRLNASIASAQSSAENVASSARTIAIIALVVGAIGVVVGVVAVASSRKRG